MFTKTIDHLESNDKENWAREVVELKYLYQPTLRNMIRIIVTDILMCTNDRYKTSSKCNLSKYLLMQLII